MAQFAYKARRRSGEVVQGVLDVADRAAALSQIERLGLFPVMVDASKAGMAAVAKAEAPGTGNLHHATRELAQVRDAAHGRAAKHVAPGVEGHSIGREQKSPAGRHGGQKLVRLDGQAAGDFLRPLPKHGAGG